MVNRGRKGVEPIKLSKSSRDSNKRQKRKRILTAAAELFKEKGFSHVSISQIAEKSGVTQVTIFNHFGNKYQLVEEVVAMIADEKVEKYRQVLISEKPWTERLQMIITDKRKTLRDFKGEFLMSLFREYPELKKRILNIQPRIRKEIIFPFLDEGRRLGTVPAGISDEAVAGYLQVIMRGFDNSPDMYDRMEKNDGFFDQIYDLIIYGLIRSGEG